MPGTSQDIQGANMRSCTHPLVCPFTCPLPLELPLACALLAAMASSVYAAGSAFEKTLKASRMGL